MAAAAAAGWQVGRRKRGDKVKDRREERPRPRCIGGRACHSRVDEGLLLRIRVRSCKQACPTLRPSAPVCLSDCGETLRRRKRTTRVIILLVLVSAARGAAFGSSLSLGHKNNAGNDPWSPTPSLELLPAEGGRRSCPFMLLAALPSVCIVSAALSRNVSIPTADGRARAGAGGRGRAGKWGHKELDRLPRMGRKQLRSCAAMAGRARAYADQRCAEPLNFLPVIFCHNGILILISGNSISYQ